VEVAVFAGGVGSGQNANVLNAAVGRRDGVTGGRPGVCAVWAKGARGGVAVFRGALGWFHK